MKRTTLSINLLTLATVFLLSSSFTTATNLTQQKNNTSATVLNCTIRITVVDNEGNPIPGASIKLKGATTGVQTDANGKATLTIPEGDQTIEVSTVGFIKQEIKVNCGYNGVVTLIPES